MTRTPASTLANKPTAIGSRGCAITRTLDSPRCCRHYDVCQATIAHDVGRDATRCVARGRHSMRHRATFHHSKGGTMTRHVMSCGLALVGLLVGGVAGGQTPVVQRPMVQQASPTVAPTADAMLIAALQQRIV